MKSSGYSFDDNFKISTGPRFYINRLYNTPTLLDVLDYADGKYTFC